MRRRRERNTHGSVGLRRVTGSRAGGDGASVAGTMYDSATSL